MGVALGLLGGIALAAILIYVVNPKFFGWTIQTYVPWSSLVIEIATIFGAAMVASVYPAMRAARTPATELTREDV